MATEPLDTAVLEVLRVVLKTEVGPHTTRADTPAWDSLRHIELMFALEEAFDCRFSEDDLDRLADVPALVARIGELHAARPGA